ncbi:MAG: response regulator transcription factor [Halieaceae bacterium]|nr:response regulator transcription factor [Halieaceae bacterium]
MRLLIVEDDPRLRERLVGHFSAQGWVVDGAPDGREAQYLAEQYPCDIAIVDLGLPDISGIELIRRWREQNMTMPILILTARADWQDKVTGLEAGADDYVTKPFYLEEVEARLSVLLRRVEGRHSNKGVYGRLAIDFGTRQVTVDERPVDLTTYEFNTLAYLAHRQGAAVGRGELLDHLYDRDADRDSNVIEVFIGRLRKKLDPEGDIKPIETLRGVGYRFVLTRESA